MTQYAKVKLISDSTLHSRDKFTLKKTPLPWKNLDLALKNKKTHPFKTQRKA